MFEVTLFYYVIHLITINTLFSIIKMSLPYLKLSIIIVSTGIIPFLLLLLSNMIISNIYNGFAIKKNTYSELSLLLKNKGKDMIYTRQWL